MKNNGNGLGIMLRYLVEKDASVIFEDYFIDLLAVIQEGTNTLTDADRTVVLEKLTALYSVYGVDYHQALNAMAKEAWQ